MNVTLVFHLDEEVTPVLFAEKVALACAHRGTLREGEGISVPDVPLRFTYEGDKDVDLFGTGNLISIPHISRKLVAE